MRRVPSRATNTERTRPERNRRGADQLLAAAFFFAALRAAFLSTLRLDTLRGAARFTAAFADFAFGLGATTIAGATSLAAVAARAGWIPSERNSEAACSEG